MTTKIRIIPALLASLFAAVGGAQAEAAQFSNVVGFGDSLSDVGYYRGFLASIGLPAAQMGRFSTNPDPIWIEILSQYYGVTAKPSNAGGTIYAQGGARVALTPGITPPGQAERPVSTQITEYLAAHGGAADPNALYTMWAGANDFFVNFSQLQAGAITPAQLQTNVLAAVTAEVQQVGRLYQAGARNVMVFTSFDGSMTPSLSGADAATRASVQALTVGANTTLLAGLASNGLRAIPVDLFSLFNEIRANPASFGFSNITGVACGPLPPVSATSSALFCLQGLNVAPGAQNTLLWADPTGHMTAAGNRVVAAFAQGMIEGPYNYSFLAEAPLRTRMLHVQGVAEGLSNGSYGEIGKFTAFFAGGGGQFNVASDVGNVGVSNRNEAYTIGGTVRASPNITLGAAFGQTRTSSTLGMGSGDFKTRDYSYSVFGALRMGGFYADGVATIANIDYNDIHRNITLNALNRQITTNTSGSNASVFLNGGYDFRVRNFLIGPVVSATWQNVGVSAFDEAGGGSSNLHIGEQTRNSQVWSAGVRASADWEGFTPWIRFTADKETEDSARFVTASPLSLAATGNSYDIMAYAPDSSYTTFQAGIRTLLAPNIAVGVSYYKVSGRSGINEWAASAALTYKF